MFEDPHVHHQDEELHLLEIFAGCKVPLRPDTRERITIAANNLELDEVKRLFDSEWRIQHAYLAELLGLRSDEPDDNVLDILFMKRAEAIALPLDAERSVILAEERRIRRSLSIGELRMKHHLIKLGYVLAPHPKPLGIYVPAMVSEVVFDLAGERLGKLKFSGHGPWLLETASIKGKVADIEAGQRAARQVALNVLHTLEHTVGLHRVKRLVHTFGMVNVAPGFIKCPAVINGFSEVFRNIFGEEFGVGTRSAIGVAELPEGISVEVEGEVHVRI